MYEHTLISEHSNSLVLFLYIFLMYLKAESDHSTLALVAGMTNNISKKKKKKIPICFSRMTEIVWDRDFGLQFGIFVCPILFP